MYDKFFCEEHDCKVWKNTKLYRDAPKWEEDKEGNSRRYKCRDFSGVAVWVLGWEIEYNECSGRYRKNGSLLVVMVGDDHAHSVDPHDLTPIKDLDYCASCGQIGCSHDGRDRSEED